MKRHANGLRLLWRGKRSSSIPDQLREEAIQEQPVVREKPRPVTRPLEFPEYMSQEEIQKKAGFDCIQEFDKAILTLASSLFTLSVAFIHQTAPKPIDRPLIGLAWVFLALSVISTLFGKLCGWMAHQKELEILDRRYDGDEDAALEPNRWNLPAGFTNWSSLGFFVAGLFCLIAFHYLNLGR